MGERFLVTILLILLFITIGCGVKMEQLPLLSHPYVSEVEFLKEVKNVNGKAKKTPFDRDRITSPFYFFLKVKEIENNGTLAVVFYEDTDKTSKKVAEKTFFFGESGKYYEYIIFFDQVEGLSPGQYRCVVFINQHLIYECHLQVNNAPGSQGATGGMFQVGPADGENLHEQHFRRPEHAPCDRQPFFLTKEVNPIVKSQAICMPGKIKEKSPIMSLLKDNILKKDDIILYRSPMKISCEDTRRGAKKKWT